MGNPSRSWRGRVAKWAGVATCTFPLIGTGALLAQTESAPPKTAATSPHAAPALTLAECMRIALQQQPALAAQRASLAAAEEGYQGAEELHVPVFLARDLPIRRQQAGLGVTIAVAGLNQAEWETVYAVTRTYFGVVYARQQLHLVDDLVNSLHFYQDRVRELVTKGTGPKEWTTSTVDKITVYVGLAEVRRSEALNGIEKANAALREAMGVGPELAIGVAEQSLPNPKVTAHQADIVSLALARRGELIQITTAAQVTDLEVQAQAKTLRSQAKTFAFGADVHARPVPQGMSNREYRPGAVGLEMPPSLAGPRSSRIEHAQDLNARAAAAVDKTRNLIALEAEAMYYKWEDAARRVASGQTAEEAGNRLAKNTREDFRAGQRVKIEDILMNEALAAQAAASYNEALYDLVVALADLQRVTAGGFDAGFGAVEAVCGTPAPPAAP
jgi:outer membrane protein TolC